LPDVTVNVFAPVAIELLVALVSVVELRFIAAAVEFACVANAFNSVTRFPLATISASDAVINASACIVLLNAGVGIAVIFCIIAMIIPYVKPSIVIEHIDTVGYEISIEKSL